MPAATDSQKPTPARGDRRSAARLATLVAVPVTLVLLGVAVVAGLRAGSGAEPVAPATSVASRAADRRSPRAGVGFGESVAAGTR